MRIETIGDATLYLGDSREILPTLGRVDAVVTDPPYGIGADEAAAKNKGKWGWKYYGESSWDRKRPEKDLMGLISDRSKILVIWGGNYFADLLPASSKWLVWDKGQTDFSLADCELAWCSFGGAVRRIAFSRSKAMQDGKEHPTQKPIEVMRWCIDQLPTGCGTILDPFMGSGTTGVACAKMGRRFIGCEISERYFDIACRRIAEAYRQPDMFVAPATRPTQLALEAAE